MPIETVKLAFDIEILEQTKAIIMIAQDLPNEITGIQHLVIVGAFPSASRAYALDVRAIGMMPVRDGDANPPVVRQVHAGNTQKLAKLGRSKVFYDMLCKQFDQSIRS